MNGQPLDPSLRLTKPEVPRPRTAPGCLGPRPRTALTRLSPLVANLSKPKELRPRPRPKVSCKTRRSGPRPIGVPARPMPTGGTGLSPLPPMFEKADQPAAPVLAVRTARTAVGALFESFSFFVREKWVWLATAALLHVSYWAQGLTFRNPSITRFCRQSNRLKSAVQSTAANRTRATGRTTTTAERRLSPYSANQNFSTA